MILANVIEIWNTAWPAGVIMLGLGAVFAVVLLVASEKLKVQEDPKVVAVRDILPSIDCGACGFAGCGSYAKAVVADPELIGKCAPGGADVSNAIGEALNLQISADGAPKRPVVHCRAHTNDRTYYAKYEGIESCVAVNALANYQACKFGCLGFGDCVASCKFGAVIIVDGLATVDYEKCTGCGACAKACPRNLIEMIPFAHENMMVVGCSSNENGKTTRGMCKVGCIGCGLCVKQTELFTIKDFNARMDYENYAPDEKTETAYQKCPTCVIVYRGKNAPPPRVKEVKKPAPKPA